jgi:hypothetical protein
MMKRLFGLLVVLFLAAMSIVPLSSAADEPPIVVGRVYHVEGDMLRYVPEENDWVAAIRDAPFSAGDTLYTGSRGQAELIVPNGTWIRIGDSTQVQFIGLEPDVSEVDVAAGLARFYNKDSDLVIKATSPFGYVLVYPGSVFDFYVGENSAEVVAIQGTLTFVHAPTNARYEVAAGNPSILADMSQVSSEDGAIDPNWDGWNRTRESFWASKGRTTGRSVQYLPPALRHDAYVFEENGRWEQVHYEGGNRWFWRPTRVTPGWAPFTNGRWTDWYGDQTWIPSEPFGYTTHHYGNWIYARNNWYWAPPVATVTVGLPLLNIGFFWNPGRVSWIHSGSNVGWVPLAPRETYYSHRRWGGPHVVHVTNVNITQINVYPRNYAYARHAVVVPQRDFYTVNNYKTVRVKNINNTTIINNYQAAPVVSNKVITNYSTIKQRRNFANVQVKEKPHRTVTERIEANQKIIAQGRRERPAVLQQQVKGIKEGKVNREAKIQQPKVTNYIVPATEINRPKSEMKLQQKEIKKATRDESGVSPRPTVKPGKPSAKPEGVETEKPGKTKGVAPSKPATKPEAVAPPNPATKPERVAPAKPGQKIEGEVSEKPTPKDRVVPAKPQPKEKLEKLAPAKDEDADKPNKKPVRGAPAKVRSQDRQKGDPDEQEKPR